MKKKPGEVLAQHAHARTDQVRMKLRDAMKTIELEIEENEGIYPFQGGRLSLSEVCRRAGVHKVTLQGPSHRDTSKPMVEDWIKSIKVRLITGRKTVRSTVTARANDWEARFKAIANNFNEMYAIDVIAKDKAIREFTERVATLEAENLMLRSELSEGRVVRMPDRPEKEKKLTTSQKSDEPLLILIRGVPGSGKSTLARKYDGYLHLEADMFFFRDGVYVFDPDMLPAAHQWCLAQTREALARGQRVVVSNIFSHVWETKAYIDLGFPFEILSAKGCWPSIHGVPREKIERMRSSWISDADLIKDVEKL